MVALHEPLRSLLDLVGEVHDAEDRRAFREALLPAARRLIASDWSSYTEAHPAHGEVIAFGDPPLPEWCFPVWTRLVGDGHPIVNHHQRTRDGRAYRISDFWSQETFHASPIYRELYVHLGVEHQIAVALPSPADVTIGIVLSRGGDRDYTEEDRALLDLARPHLVQAWRNALLRERAAVTLAALGDGLDGAGVLLLLVGDDGVVTFASPGAASALEAASDGPVRIDGPLPPALRRWLAGDASAPFVRDGLVVRHVPGRRDGQALLVLEPGSATLVADRLRDLGLTEREAEVLRWIALGRSAGDTAQRLGVSPRTVHKHLEHVYAKLGVGGRSQAAAVAWATVGTQG